MQAVTEGCLLRNLHLSSICLKLLFLLVNRVWILKDEKPLEVAEGIFLQNHIVILAT